MNTSVEGSLQASSPRTLCYKGMQLKWHATKMEHRCSILEAGWNTWVVNWHRWNALPYMLFFLKSAINLSAACYIDAGIKLGVFEM